jgi:hypothetical protein
MFSAHVFEEEEGHYRLPKTLIVLKDPREKKLPHVR